MAIDQTKDLSEILVLKLGNEGGSMENLKKVRPDRSSPKPIKRKDKYMIIKPGRLGCQFSLVITFVQKLCVCMCVHTP